MKFLEFKSLLSTLIAGNNAFRDDEALKTLIFNSIIEVAKKTDPLLLVTSDCLENRIIKKIDDGVYLKEPNKISSDESIVLIDDDLIPAVAHIVITYFSVGEKILRHKTLATTIIENYNWERFNSFGDEFDILNVALEAVDFHGYKKIYISKIKTINNTYRYVWDMDFVSKLDKFLINRDVSLSKSDFNNINLFISFAENIMTEKNEEYENINKFDNYLGSL